jgi:hypothetical protein
MDNWDFAIYRYSTERYDPEEWFFPGEEYVILDEWKIS